MIDESYFRDNLPYYLTGERKDGFLRHLADFQLGKPVNYFQSSDDAEIFQGDVTSGFVVSNIETQQFKRVQGIAISNSCDISRENERELQVSIVFAPTVSLENFHMSLIKSGVDRERADQKLKEIRGQRITDLFYLPNTEESPELIAMLSKVSSMPFMVYEKNGPKISHRLSQLGHYLFLFKLSFHFCRFHEEIDRAI